MRYFFIFITLVFCLSGFSVELPSYLGEVKGLVLTTLTGREGFEFQPGQVGDCTKTQVTGLDTYRCEIKNAAARVTPSTGEALFVLLTELRVMYVTLKNGQIRQRYLFGGTWISMSSQAPLSTKVHLELWNYKSTPHDVKGVMTLSDYGMGAAIQGTQQR